MPDFPTDAYFKKEVTLNHNGRKLRFRTSDALFSSHDIDDGTRLLLKTLTPDVLGGRSKVLDVGCGSGPLGIALAAAGAREVHMVDRDALAVSYSEQNAALNAIDAVRTYGSLGYDDVDKDYDLVVSNVPAKAGAPVIEHLLLDARHHLAPDGLVAIVVIAPIATEVEGVLRGDSGVEVVFERRAAAFTVFHYRFVGDAGDHNERSGFERGLYDDEIAQATHKLLLEATPQEPVESAIVVNPTIDLVAAFAADRITLIGRDLLALRQSEDFLAAAGTAVSIHHAAGVPNGAPASVIVATLIDDEGQTAHEEQVTALVERLMRGGTMIIAGSSTAITRVERSLKPNKLVRVEDRKRKRGESVLILSSKR